MKIKMKKMLGIILSFALVLGLMPGMNMTAYAETSYGAYLVTDSDTAETLKNKVVQFNRIGWYIIKDESKAENAGTITLLVQEKLGDPRSFDSSVNTYSNSGVKQYLDGLTDTAFAGVSEAIKYYNGEVTERNITSSLNVRPALKLNLSSVIFDSESKTFSLKSAGYNVTLSGGANATTSGGAISQTGLTGAMTVVTYTANTGYYFAEFADITDNGITAKRTSSTVVTVSGTPTADATITVPDAITNDDTQQNPDGTKTVTKENADGKTITVTNYSKTDEQISQFVFEKAKGTKLDLKNVNSKTLKTVVVPESVKANGNTYKVTRIRKGFLKNCKQATKVDIGKNINTIDKNAFNYGKKVKKVVIRGKLKKVGKNAFKNTKKNVVIKVKTSAKNFKKNKTLLEKSGLPKNATVKRVKNKK